MSRRGYRVTLPVLLAEPVLEPPALFAGDGVGVTATGEGEGEGECEGEGEGEGEGKGGPASDGATVAKGSEVLIAASCAAGPEVAKLAPASARTTMPAINTAIHQRRYHSLLASPSTLDSDLP
jgi:hypothetical protein